jgi:anti-sigma B factor antagonist
MDPPFDIITSETPTGVLVRLVGELDMSTIVLLQQVTVGLIGDGRDEVTVDLRDVAFMDSSGLHALLALRGYAEANGAHLMVVPGPDPVMRIVRIAGVHHAFEFVDGPTRSLSRTARIVSVPRPARGPSPRRRRRIGS